MLSYTKGEKMTPLDHAELSVIMERWDHSTTALQRQVAGALVGKLQEVEAVNRDLLAACQASELEYSDLDEYAPVNPHCPDCNQGLGPVAETCAHHLRVAAIRKATGA